MKKIKKKSLTLIEIMVVIALIGIIGSVVGVNMKKSMDKAKAFKAKMQIQKIEDCLNLYYAENNVEPSYVQAQAPQILEDSGLFKETQQILKNPYGEELEVIFDNGGFICQLKQAPQTKQGKKQKEN